MTLQATAIGLSIIAVAVSVLMSRPALAAFTRKQAASEEAREASTGLLLRVDALLDPRSTFQAALGTVGKLASDLDESGRRRATEQLIQMLRESPVLLACGIIGDPQLAEIESSSALERVSVVSLNEQIEFDYASAGPSFTSIVLSNLERGVRYRYLVPDTPKSRSRAAEISRDGLTIGFLSKMAWTGLELALDEFVIYDLGDRTRCFYMFPDVDPRRWIEVDDATASSRLDEVNFAWEG
jgi:hypothetical protein